LCISELSNVAIAKPTRNELYPNKPQLKKLLSNPIKRPERLPQTIAMIPWTATREDWINIAARISRPLMGLFWKNTYMFDMEFVDE
jgi:hypothetical protein